MAKGKVIALTGGIACGKSEVAKLFEARGAMLIDADILAREVVAAGTPGLDAVVNTFGSGVLQKDGSLNRSTLGSIVFNDKAKRRLLEDILHPRIRDLFLSRLADARAANPDALIVYVVPLFFESRFPYEEVDKVVVVSAPEEVAIDRIIARDRCTRALAEAKIRAQIPIDEKEKRANFVIKNEGSIKDLDAQVSAIVKTLGNHEGPASM